MLRQVLPLLKRSNAALWQSGESTASGHPFGVLDTERTQQIGLYTRGEKITRRMQGNVLSVWATGGPGTFSVRDRQAALTADKTVHGDPENQNQEKATKLLVNTTSNDNRRSLNSLSNHYAGKPVR